MNPAHATPLPVQSCEGCTEMFRPHRTRQRYCSPRCHNRRLPKPTLPPVKTRWRRRKDNAVFVVEATFTAEIGTRIRARLEFGRHYKELTPEAWRKEFERL